MLRRQHEFRMAANVVTDALMGFDEVEAVAVIGSVCRGSGDRVAKSRVEVATLSRSL